MYIDTHCHLNFAEFDADRAMVIGNAKKAGVKQFIVPGVDPKSSDSSVALAHIHPGIVFSAIGFHPYEAQQISDTKHLEKLLKENRARIVAIGECGLDYHMYKGHEAESKKDNQKRLFAAQLALAAANNIPVVMHCRDAFGDFFDVLDSLPTLPSGVIHCFSGGLQELRIAKERNLLVGIDGNVTYSKQLAITVPAIPVDMLLLETDAPYLTPEPHRGIRNEPKYIPLIAQKIAELIDKSVADVMEATTTNAKTLFAL